MKYKQKLTSISGAVSPLPIAKAMARAVRSLSLEHTRSARFVRTNLQSAV
jgi:hypothetical protein